MATDSSVSFSIITPTYNRAWCIERAIKSVLCQEFQDWELIVVDDGSTDNTKIIVEKYLADPRIKYFYKKNGGVGSARNIGIKQSHGKFLMFLDSDDEFVLDALKLVRLTVSRYKNVGILSFGAIDKNGRKISYTENVLGDKKITFAEFVSQEYIKGEAFLVFRGDIFNGNTFDEDVNGGEGLLLFGLIKEHGLMIINTDARIYHTESLDSLISSRLTKEKIWNIFRIQSRLIERYESDLKQYNKKYLGTMYFVAARALALSGEKSASLRYFFSGFRYNFLDIKRIVLYGVSLFDYDLKINNILNSLYSKYRYE